MINPTPTTCIAMSLEIPKREHATGINRREPPAIPDAPHAESVAKILNTIAVGTLTLIPSVCAAANVITVIVIAAPSMLIVEPSGIDTE